MAPLARRTWSENATEVTVRLGNRSETGFSTRVQYWIAAAYSRLCAMWAHEELSVSADRALGQGARTVDLPTDCLILQSVELWSDEGKFLRTLTPRHAEVIWSQTSSIAARPAMFCRFGSDLFLQSPTDAAYRLVLRYYKTPTAPDFTGSKYPETNALWDEAILEMAAAQGSVGVWRPDLSSPMLSALAAFAQKQVQPDLADAPIAERETHSLENKRHVGKLG